MPPGRMANVQGEGERECARGLKNERARHGDEPFFDGLVTWRDVACLTLAVASVGHAEAAPRSRAPTASPENAEA